MGKSWKWWRGRIMALAITWIGPAEAQRLVFRGEWASVSTFDTPHRVQIGSKSETCIVDAAQVYRCRVPSDAALGDQDVKLLDREGRSVLFINGGAGTPVQTWIVAPAPDASIGLTYIKTQPKPVSPKLFPMSPATVFKNPSKYFAQPPLPKASTPGTGFPSNPFAQQLIPGEADPGLGQGLLIVPSQPRVLPTLAELNGLLTSKTGIPVNLGRRFDVQAGTIQLRPAEEDIVREYLRQRGLPIKPNTPIPFDLTSLPKAPPSGFIPNVEISDKPGTFQIPSFAISQLNRNKLLQNIQNSSGDFTITQEILNQKLILLNQGIPSTKYFLSEETIGMRSVNESPCQDLEVLKTDFLTLETARQATLLLGTEGVIDPIKEPAGGQADFSGKDLVLAQVNAVQASIQTGVEAAFQNIGATTYNSGKTPLIYVLDTMGANFSDDFRQEDPNDKAEYRGHGQHFGWIAKKYGETPDADLRFIKVCRSDGRCEMVKIILGICAAVAEGKKSGRPVLVNLSLGTTIPGKLLKEVMIYAAKNRVKFMASHGNIEHPNPEYYSCKELREEDRCNQYPADWIGGNRSDMSTLRMNLMSIAPLWCDAGRWMPLKDSRLAYEMASRGGKHVAPTFKLPGAFAFSAYKGQSRVYRTYSGSSFATALALALTRKYGSENLRDITGTCGSPSPAAVKK